MKRSDERGFTLLELMLVVIIIGILAVVVLPRFTGKTREARITAARLQIESLSLALDNFEMDNGCFPTTEQGLEALRTRPDNASNWKGPYIKRRIPLDPWGKPYVYRSPGVQNIDYDLFSFGPDGAEGTEDDITTWKE